MPETITVITAVHEPSLPYLEQAFESLAAQQLPADWDWEWLVQLDGSGALPSYLDADPRISASTGRRGGPGVARTLALGRATGSLVKVLDADDALLPGALARDIAALSANPDVGWTTAKVLDWLPDGSRVGWDWDDPAEGRLLGDDVFRFWLDHDYRLPIMPATICIRRELLLALGGWMALPASEDTGMLLAAAAVADGYFIAGHGLLYRKWEGQSTAQAAYTDPTERLDRVRLIDARTRALAGGERPARSVRSLGGECS